MTTATGAPIVPHQPPSLPELRAADRGVAEALESVLSHNTRRTYEAQWRLFTGWCDEVGLQALPAEPLTVARYLATRANSKAHEWVKVDGADYLGRVSRIQNTGEVCGGTGVDWVLSMAQSVGGS